MEKKRKLRIVLTVIIAAAVGLLAYFSYDLFEDKTVRNIFVVVVAVIGIFLTQVVMNYTE